MYTYHPCMVYFPTVMWVNIPYMDAMGYSRFKERQPLNKPTLGCSNVKSSEQTSRSADSKNLQTILPCNSKTVTRLVQTIMVCPCR